MMGAIYGQARQVLVFLGEMTEEVTKSLDQILWLDQFLTKNDKDYSVGVVPYDLPRDGSILTGELADYSETGFDWEPVIALLHRPWFGRLWVVQEVVLAEHAVVFCGNRSLSWDVVEKVFGTLSAHGLLAFFPEKAKTRSGQNITSMGLIRQRRTLPGKEPGLLDLVAMCRNVQCTDPRDRVYALLGLANDVSSQDLEVMPDYALTIEEVYKGFSIWNLSHTKDLRCLSYSSLSSRSQLSLPSWVPDYTLLEVEPPLARAEIELPYNAARGTEPILRFSDGRNTLHIHGYTVDSVGMIGSLQAEVSIPDPLPELSQQVNEAQDSTALIQTSIWIKECWKIATTKYGEDLPLERYEDFWRAMICNRTSTGQMAPHEYGTSFRRYLEFFLQKVFSNQAGEWDKDLADAMLLIDRSLSGWQRHRRFCSTDNDRLGWVPGATAIGDVVCIFNGGRVPFVLRPASSGIYTWVGECYIHGIMEGEAMLISNPTLREFTIQ